MNEIVGKRIVNDTVYYRVNWVGYSSKDNTWEPDTNLQNSRVAIARFEKNFKTKKVPKK